MMMAMVRLNVPSIFIYGGSILPGNFRGQTITVQDMFEAVGRHSVGSLSDDDLDEMEHVACPSAGACGAQFTANTMATVSEAIGLALPYSCGAPAPYEIRDALCAAAGEQAAHRSGYQGFCHVGTPMFVWEFRSVESACLASGNR